MLSEKSVSILKAQPSDSRLKRRGHAAFTTLAVSDAFKPDSTHQVSDSIILRPLQADQRTREPFSRLLARALDDLQLLCPHIKNDMKKPERHPTS